MIFVITQWQAWRNKSWFTEVENRPRPEHFDSLISMKAIIHSQLWQDNMLLGKRWPLLQRHQVGTRCWWILKIPGKKGTADTVSPAQTDLDKGGVWNWVQSGNHLPFNVLQLESLQQMGKPERIRWNLPFQKEFRNWFLEESLTTIYITFFCINIHHISIPWHLVFFFTAVKGASSSHR